MMPQGSAFLSSVNSGLTLGTGFQFRGHSSIPQVAQSHFAGTSKGHLLSRQTNLAGLTQEPDGCAVPKAHLAFTGTARCNRRPYQRNERADWGPRAQNRERVPRWLQRVTVVPSIVIG